MRTRIAPTPSGFLHRGNAANFMLTAALVAARDGELMLRVDDLDRERVRIFYLENIFVTLDYLSIRPHIGPRNLADLEREWSQLHRLVVYHQALDKLRTKGLVYACDCSRKRLRDSKGNRYDGHCRNRDLSLDDPKMAWRIRVPSGTEIRLDERLNPERSPHRLDLEMGDFIVRKKGGMPAYQLSSCLDDILYSITDVVRGIDLFQSSLAQEYLRRCLDVDDAPWRHYHHPLLKNVEGQKLSKSAGAAAILDWTRPDFELDKLRREIREWLPKKDPFWANVMLFL